MSKFGELIDQETPILLDFFTDRDQQTVAMNVVLNDVALSLSGKAKILKIDVDKNPELVKALQIKVVPTLMLYKQGEMVWRESGAYTSEDLLQAVQEFV